MTRNIPRRRFIAISAAALGMGVVGAANASNETTHRWRGVALGADAHMTLHHPDPAAAEKMIAAALAEVRRLERIFSLYHPNSALGRLNANGKLSMPPPELVTLLERARDISKATNGAFDVTVQPLWHLYATHFADSGADPDGPGPMQLKEALNQVDYGNLAVDAREISFTAPGMAVTLNGIAQGYITDHVTARLRALGMSNVLVHMGETLAIGEHPDGRAWRFRMPGGRTAQLRDAAVATSGIEGFTFDDAGLHNHILDPRSGLSPTRWRTASVIAQNATTADALSTAAMLLPAEAVHELCRRYNSKLYARDANGNEFAA